ncbi:MAG: hypothetical protein H6997_08265, partial [Moraxellaceae bacterium]|nr:hypothetical protein [Moraxellaceae bacterium]
MITTLKTAPLTIPAIELPIDLNTQNLDLRLLPYWSGVKHFRQAQLNQQSTPQDYYWHIVRHNQNPTVVSGKIVSFHSRSDMYFSRLPLYTQHKMWFNFGTHHQLFLQ